MSEEQGDPSEPKIVVDEDWKARVEAEKAVAASATSATGQSETAPQSKSRKTQKAPPLPPASFCLLVTSLATQAMALLGEAESPRKDPNDPEADPDSKALSDSALELARHAIDTLHMLEEKTRGNLVREESAVLTSTLHELRMMYVAIRDRKRP
jgi:hypothetical protein